MMTIPALHVDQYVHIRTRIYGQANLDDEHDDWILRVVY